MCLLAFDWNPNPPRGTTTNTTTTTTTTTSSSNRRLIMAVNRDEYYNRPTDTAHFWNERPHIYASRDRVLGGTWLAVSQTGRMAVLTNYHCKQDVGMKFPRSRGDIPVDFCDGTSSSMSAIDFAKELQQRQGDYKGFNAVLFDGQTVVYCCNRCTTHFYHELPAGTYGLSNHLLDTPWPKVERTKHAVGKRLRPNMTRQQMEAVLLEEFTNPERVEDERLIPNTLGKDLEKNLSAIFVQGPNYGTRTTTILSFDGRGFDVFEKNYETPCTKASSSYQRVDCLIQ